MGAGPAGYGHRHGSGAASGLSNARRAAAFPAHTRHERRSLRSGVQWRAFPLPSELSLGIGRRSYFLSRSNTRSTLSFAALNSVGRSFLPKHNLRVSPSIE